MRRIICIGNRLVTEDSAGARVHDALHERSLPPDLEVIDGGLAGLDLLRFADGAERLVFVDAVSGLGAPGAMELPAGEIAQLATVAHHHAAGLPYLLRALDFTCEGPPPEVRVVGVEGALCPALVARAAELALQLALEPERR